MGRPGSDGRTSSALTQRSSVSPVSTTGWYHWSWPAAGCVHGVERTTRSGSPSSSYFSARRQTSSAGHAIGGGASAGSPGGAPASTQRTTVSISASLSDMSLAKSRMPTVLSMCHGGILRAATFSLMARAHGRTSR